MCHLKFIYSEKATKFCKTSTEDLSYVVLVKSTVEILQNFVAFSEYMNFNVFFIAMNMTCKWELPPSNATTVIRLLDQGGVICLTDDALFHGGLILVKWHQRFSSQFTLRTYAAQWAK